LSFRKIFFASSGVKTTLVKVPLQQRHLPVLLKINV